MSLEQKLIAWSWGEYGDGTIPNEQIEVYNSNGWEIMDMSTTTDGITVLIERRPTEENAVQVPSEYERYLAWHYENKTTYPPMTYHEFNNFKRNFPSAEESYGT